MKARAKNPERYRDYMREYSAKNRKKLNDQMRARFHANIRWIRAYKEAHGCQLCSERDPRCLDFHHIDPATKKRAIAHMTWGQGKESILKEIAKCNILCANCHRKLYVRKVV
jgi:hypothetical protein